MLYKPNILALGSTMRPCTIDFRSSLSGVLPAQEPTKRTSTDVAVQAHTPAPHHHHPNPNLPFLPLLFQARFMIAQRTCMT
ncbi:hypothetical protein H2248_012251 [Termitomyces sp. 'cryptogamus']|nr:hypothetical protein H2248_012251 [Termitomyces sp. 'cryptogamus']